MKNTLSYQKALTCLVISLLFIMPSCRNSILVSPTAKEDNISEETLSVDVQEVKEWFDNRIRTNNLVCSKKRTYKPIWTKVRKGLDREEFEVLDNNRFIIPRFSDPTSKEGKKIFVSKKLNGNNRIGTIVNFIPFNSFKGDIKDITTTNFRGAQFSGIILFEELDGCEGNAYIVYNGTVFKTLEIQSEGKLASRGYCPQTVSWSQQVSDQYGNTYGDPTYLGETTQWNWCPDPFGYNTSFISSYDYARLTSINQNGTGGATNDNSYTYISSSTLFSPDQGGKDIESLKKYIDCFNASMSQSNSNFKVTIFVEEPKPGSDWYQDNDFGHTFVRLEVNGIGQNFGFYPVSGVSAALAETNGKLKDNGMSPYNSSISFNVNATQFQAALNVINSWSFARYNAYSANCTDFAISVGNSLGIVYLPDPVASIYGQTTSTPGRFGYALRQMPTSPNYSVSQFSFDQTAPASSGPCQ